MITSEGPAEIPPSAGELAEAQRKLDAYNEATGSQLTLDRPEPLDVDACVENLGIFAARGDARSCRDVGIALAAEVQNLRGQIGLVRDALRRAGRSVDEVAGDDLAALIDRHDRDARDCVWAIGAENAQLREENQRMRRELGTLIRMGQQRAEDFKRANRHTLAFLWRQVADIADESLTREEITKKGLIRFHEAKDGSWLPRHCDGAGQPPKTEED